MSLRLEKRYIALLSLVAACNAVTANGAEPSGEAFREGMIAGHWSSAHKQFLGTAYESYDAQGGYSESSSTAPISRVWFTGAQGVLTEVFWPSIDTPQTVDSQFLVSDGGSFFFEERHGSQTHVDWLGQGIPAFHVTNTDPSGKFVIEKTVFADPDRDVVLQHIKITRNVAGLHFYYLHKPAVSNTPMGNSARVSVGSTDLGAGLYAWENQQAQAVVFSVPLKQVSAGFSGGSDGYQDINAHHTMTYAFETATSGNVALTAWLDLPETRGVTEFDVAIGFASEIRQAGASARASLQAGVASLQAKYISQWKQYQGSILDLTGSTNDGGDLFRASVAALKSSEDKTHAGAFVASPTIPWGEHQTDNNSIPVINGSRSHLTTGYHLIWPRDLYQMATAFMAVHDNASAVAALNFLKSIQETDSSGSAWSYGFRTRSRDGSFPQNAWTNGDTGWTGLQLDEVSMPVVLAYRLWKSGAIRAADYWDMVKRAADFVAGFGPWSPMERWEEIYGASPSTIAAEIAALRAASQYAQAMGDSARAQNYRGVADAWASKPGDNVETWTCTTTGDFGNGHYYTRIQGGSSFNEVWNPNTNQQLSLANGSGQWPEKDLVDGGFLELVRFGVRPALDPAIAASIPIYDSTIRADIPGVGPGFHRYTHDRYNYDGDTGAQTDGMIWPIFTGERGHYELQKAIESGKTGLDLDASIAPWVQTMEKMATSEHFLPEQVWDSGPKAGQSTGSATPLGWSHGEYLRLLRSRNDRQVFDRE